MSDTHRRHESLGAKAKRGPKNRPEEPPHKVRLKNTKQARSNDRVSLRKEWR